MATDLVLASTSPRRLDLLRTLDLKFLVLPSGIDETIVPGETPRDHAIRLSCEKARAVAGTLSKGFVIGADTIVVLDECILGKPADAGEAFDMLSRLSGREHEVITGYCVIDVSAGVEACREVTTRVHMKRLERGEIDGYIATGEPFDKAGAYAIQGKGMYKVTSIAGSYTNVVGLPIPELVETLRSMAEFSLFNQEEGNR